MPDYDNTPPQPVAMAIEPWAPLRVAFTSVPADPTAVKDGDSIDGVLLEPQDRFVCTANRPEAGIYLVGHTSSVRATDADAAADFIPDRTVFVEKGTHAGRWRFKGPAPAVLGTTPMAFEAVTTGPVPLPAETAHANTPPGSVAH